MDEHKGRPKPPVISYSCLARLNGLAPSSGPSGYLWPSIYLTGGDVSSDAMQTAVACWRPWCAAVFAARGATLHRFFYDALKCSFDHLNRSAVLDHLSEFGMFDYLRGAHPTTSKIGNRNLRTARTAFKEMLPSLQHFDCHSYLSLAPALGGDRRAPVFAKLDDVAHSALQSNRGSSTS